MVKEYKRYFVFLKKNQLVVLVAVLFSIICFGFMLTHYSLTIDEETWINNNNGSLGWISQGRFGIYLLNLIISPQGTFVPIIWDWIAVISWCLVSTFYLYSFIELFVDYKAISVFVFCSYMTCIPLFSGELLSYSMFNIHMSIALFYTANACQFMKLYIETKCKRYSFSGMLSLAFAISIYQSFLAVFLTWCAAYLLLEVLNKNISMLEILKRLIAYALIGLGTCVVYGVVNAILQYFLFPDSGYLSATYWGWGQNRSKLIAFILALFNVVRISLGINVMGHSIYGGAAIALTTCIFSLSLLIVIIKANKVSRMGLVMISIVLLLSPFSLFIALGTYNTPGRALIAMSLLGAFEWLFILHHFNKASSKVMALVALIVLVYNCILMNLLFYGSHQVYLHDKQTASLIMHEINNEHINSTDKPIVFIGMYDNTIKNCRLQSGSVCGSFFSWDDGNIGRMINFINAEGFAVDMPTSAQISEALDLAQNLTYWPNDGSIIDTDGFIVVNFSSPSEKWFNTNNIQR